MNDTGKGLLSILLFSVYICFVLFLIDKRVRMVACVLYDGIQLSLPKKMSGHGNMEILGEITSLMVNFNGSSLKQNVSFMYQHREVGTAQPSKANVRS